MFGFVSLGLSGGANCSSADPSKARRVVLQRGPGTESNSGLPRFTERAPTKRPHNSKRGPQSETGFILKGHCYLNCYFRCSCSGSAPALAFAPAVAFAPVLPVALALTLACSCCCSCSSFLLLLLLLLLLALTPALAFAVAPCSYSCSCCCSCSCSCSCSCQPTPFSVLGFAATQVWVSAPRATPLKLLGVAPAHSLFDISGFPPTPFRVLRQLLLPGFCTPAPLM